jgi:hypothetical protein
LAGNEDKKGFADQYSYQDAVIQFLFTPAEDFTIWQYPDM